MTASDRRGCIFLSVLVDCPEPRDDVRRGAVALQGGLDLLLLLSLSFAQFLVVGALCGGHAVGVIDR